MEIKQDLKTWYAISCPTTGVRFDLRMLELMDTDHDGNVRTPEVLAAIDFLKEKGVDVASLATPDAEDEKKLADVLSRQADLAKEKPSKADLEAMAAWEAQGKTAEVAVLGDGTAAAEAALAAVEKTIDAFFTPPEDMPLVTEEPDKALPLKDHLNPKHLEAILDFAAKCVTPLLGERDVLSRMDYKAVKGKFAAYRAWVAAKPQMNADANGKLVEEERFLRYKLHMGEFLENYVTMDRLYSNTDYAIFQTGILRIDGREMNLCFHVESEAAHSALAEKSHCCILYLKLTRKNEAAERSLCAVVTAGTVGALYAGRNGVFYDRDGKDWAAVVTKVVESQVSLAEAFWAPWKKLGESISGMVKKFLGDRDAAANASLQSGAQTVTAGKAENGSGGAAMASSIAAIGIGVGMVGAAAASVLAAVKGMGPVQILLSIAAIILVVSMPSVILTWFKLRKRDLGAILNASGWAVNREIRFSMKRARGFTKCAPNPLWIVYLLAFLLLLAAVVAGGWYFSRCDGCCKTKAAPAAPAAETAPATPAAASAPAA